MKILMQRSLKFIDSIHVLYNKQNEQSTYMLKKTIKLTNLKTKMSLIYNQVGLLIKPE